MLLPASAVALSLLLGSPDGTYGRIEGDLALRGAAGVTFGPRAPRGTVDLRLRYLQSAGFFATYEEGFGTSSPMRALAFGFELKPLFLGRWLRGLELGSAYPDLLFDSFGLELGVVLSQPAGGAFADRYGLQFGVALEVPLFPRSSGLFVGVHGGLRWSRATLGGTEPAAPDDRSLYLTVVLAWQQIFGGAAFADAGDKPPR